MIRIVRNERIDADIRRVRKCVCVCDWSIKGQLLYLSVRLGIEGLPVRVPPPAETLFYVLEQITISAA